MRVILIATTAVVDYIPGYDPNDAFDATDTDDLIEQAGRLCYLSWDRPNPETATNRSYMANIIKQQHFSIAEHASATFYIDGVTRNFTHELIRHRHLSFSEVSQRYVDAGQFEFVEHPGLSTIGDDERAELEDSVSVGFNTYKALANNLIEQGKKRKEARQAARHVLPSGTETKILVTGNMRAWREVLAKRLSPMADSEFQQVAREILSLLKRVAPNTFQDFDAPSG